MIAKLAVLLGLVAILGTVDNGYRGEIAVILHNAGPTAREVRPGMRVAQLVVAPVTSVNPVQVAEIDDGTARGANGFGSTGIA